MCWRYFQVVIRFDIVTKEVNWIIDIRGVTGIFSRRLIFFCRIRFNIVTNDIIWVIDIKGIIGLFFQMADFFLRDQVRCRYQIGELNHWYQRDKLDFFEVADYFLWDQVRRHYWRGQMVFRDFFQTTDFFSTAVSIGLITCCVCVGEMYVRAPTCAAVCIVGPDCVVEFFEVATDAFNTLLSVGCFDSVVGTFSHFTTSNDSASCLVIVYFFYFSFSLFWWSYSFWHV